ncbi:hypothetical protein D3C71_755690 [compost metagenome]
MREQHGGRQHLPQGAPQPAQQLIYLLTWILFGCPVEGGEPWQQLGPLAACHGVIRQPQADGIRAVETGAGEPEPESESPRHPAQEPAGAHVRVEAYGHLRHGKQAPLGHHPKIGTGEQADTAPHADAIRHADKGFGVTVDVVIEPVFLLKKIAGIGKERLFALLLPAVIEGANVAPGAKRLLPGPLQQHADDGRILLPRRECLLQALDHRQAQGIERGRAVERQDADEVPVRRGMGCDAHGVSHGTLHWVCHSASRGPASPGRRPPLRAGWHRQTARGTGCAPAATPHLYGRCAPG